MKSRAGNDAEPRGAATRRGSEMALRSTTSTNGDEMEQCLRNPKVASELKKKKVSTSKHRGRRKHV